MSKRTNKMVTRAMLVRAFTSPARPRRATLAIVAQYMGDSPIPPSWGLAGVRGTFGNSIARSWAKKIRHLHPAYYKDPTRHAAVSITPMVQTAYDFGTTPEKLAAALKKTTMDDQRGEQQQQLSRLLLAAAAVVAPDDTPPSRHGYSGGSTA